MRRRLAPDTNPVRTSGFRSLLGLSLHASFCLCYWYYFCSSFSLCFCFSCSFSRVFCVIDKYFAFSCFCHCFFVFGFVLLSLVLSFPSVLFFLILSMFFFPGFVLYPVLYCLLFSVTVIGFFLSSVPYLLQKYSYMACSLNDNQRNFFGAIFILQSMLVSTFYYNSL